MFEIQALVQQLLRLRWLLVKSRPYHPTYSFVLSSESLSFFPVIESVLTRFIRAIMCFRP